MHHEPWMIFIQDLAILLAVAAGVNILLGRFRLPIFIGYLFAGVLVSSGMGFFNPLSSSDNLKLWSEIGIIFLLFTIGLEFSIRDFFKLGASPVKTGLFETLGSFLLLLLVLKSWDLSWNSSLSLAACFTISSTAIIMKTFQEYNLKGVRFVKHVFGILVFEDIMIILMLLLLPTLAVSQLFSGSLLVEKIFLILSFLFFSVFIGFLILPRLNPLFKKLTSEGLLIFSTGLALIMASASHGAGLSFGIGAFITGSLLAQLPKREAF
jgi:monovalent cation:H+ antiporter-2, CPA2 family